MQLPEQPYVIVWKAPAAEQPLVLGSASDPDQATLAFDEHLRALQQEGRRGELVILHRPNADKPIVRQKLGVTRKRP
jgi:hypothetical protein